MTINERTEKSDRIDALRRLLAEYITSQNYTPVEMAVAITQLLASITVALGGCTTHNIAWVTENYALAVNQLNPEIGFTPEIVSSSDDLSN